MSRKRDRSPSPAASTTLPLQVFRSEQIKARDSTFVAVFSVSLSVKTLQGLPDFKTASHRMAAWRKPSRQRSIFLSKVLFDVGHDDDGEKYGGARLKTLLEDMEVEGTVVVARWFGGTMLGPMRFTHIENCAKDAIQKWKTAADEAKKAEALKRQKVEEADTKKLLVETLPERDRSIFVLRELLAEKTAALNDSGQPVPPTPVKKVDYEGMSMETLNKIDKARDASIAFILKEIDKVDEQLKEKRNAKAAQDGDPSQETYGTPIDLSEKEFEELTTPQRKKKALLLEDTG